jgi:hypothetical protein
MYLKSMDNVKQALVLLKQMIEENKETIKLNSSKIYSISYILEQQTELLKDQKIKKLENDIKLIQDKLDKITKISTKNKCKNCINNSQILEKINNLEKKIDNSSNKNLEILINDC